MASGKYICGKHGEPLNMFCNQDKEIICLTCWEDDHEDHSIKPWKKAQADLKAEVASALGLLKDDLREVENLRLRQSDIAASNRARNVDLRAKIGVQFDMLHEKLKLQEERVMDEINQLNVEAESKTTTLDSLLAQGRRKESVLQAGLDKAELGEFLDWWKETGREECEKKSTLLGQCPKLSSRLVVCREGEETKPESLLKFVCFADLVASIMTQIKPQDPKPPNPSSGFSFGQSTNKGFSFGFNSAPAPNPSPDFSSFAFGSRK